LPEDLDIPGDLFVDHCVKLEQFPEIISVGRSINVEYCSLLKKLPVISGFQKDGMRHHVYIKESGIVVDANNNKFIVYHY